MRQLYPGELKAILTELEKQIAAEEYAQQKGKWAFIAAVITNGFAVLIKVLSGKKGRPKLVEPDDFMSKDFKKLIQRILDEQKENKNYEKHEQDAKQKGLKGPW